MSGECDDCDEHTLECLCREENEIYVNVFMPYEPDNSPTAIDARYRSIIKQIKDHYERQKKPIEGGNP